eukprot:CAMPEP_0170489858 /NCGR_PEP_ID=MMETSP0208-20121228/8162_1 /TAXON_ID=197538 /ORGANISM="Strombidium inclinatum, Strain S3" /LENGTH=69 /DNA_ID=CAMNT_0010764989 /DNA_START=510 /DNA_END=715 /DNA_ORIENTATION=+
MPIMNMKLDQQIEEMHTVSLHSESDPSSSDDDSDVSNENPIQSAFSSQMPSVESLHHPHHEEIKHQTIT